MTIFEPVEDAGDFEPLGVVEEAVARVPRAAARSGYRLYRAADGFEAAIAEQVIERISAFGRVAAPHEWYGLVVARLCQDEEGAHVVVLGVVPDPDVQSGPASVQTSFDSEFRTRLAAQTLYPDAVIIGWAHTHPGLGIRYSQTDLRNQATWTQPHSLGLVVDPWHPELISVYRGPEGERLALVAGVEPRSAARSAAPAAPAARLRQWQRPERPRMPSRPTPALPARSALAKRALKLLTLAALGAALVWSGFGLAERARALGQRLAGLERQLDTVGQTASANGALLHELEARLAEIVAVFEAAAAASNDSQDEPRDHGRGEARPRARAKAKSRVAKAGGR